MIASCHQILSYDEIQRAAVMNQGIKRGRGRPPKYEAAMTGAERQSLYAKARQRDMAEVAYALKDALRTKADRKAFADIYRGSISGQRLRRGLARLLSDDPVALAFFDSLILSDDKNKKLPLKQPARHEPP